MARKRFSRTKLLGESDTQALTPVMLLGDSGYLSIDVFVDNGTSNQAPTDNPVGVWQLWIATGSGPFSQLVDDAGEIAGKLAKLSPNANNVVAGRAVFSNVPGTVAKLLYVRTSGGATARARIYASAG